MVILRQSIRKRLIRPRNTVSLNLLLSRLKSFFKHFMKLSKTNRPHDLPFSKINLEYTNRCSQNDITTSHQNFISTISPLVNWKVHLATRCYSLKRQLVELLPLLGSKLPCLHCNHVMEVYDAIWHPNPSILFRVTICIPELESANSCWKVDPGGKSRRWQGDKLTDRSLERHLMGIYGRLRTQKRIAATISGRQCCACRCSCDRKP